VKKLDLDIMGSLKMQIRTKIKRTLNKGIMFFKVIMNGEQFGSESKLGLREFTLVVVLKRKFELCKAIKELTGNFVEEQRRVTVKLRGHSKFWSF
jgi:hypothetical protein